MEQVPSDAGTADRSAKLRAFYARYVAERGGVRDPRIEQAFAAVPRELFAGPPPWYIFTANPWHGRSSMAGYIQSPDADPAFLYQDVLIALDRSRGIHIGEPSLHAHCLDALAVQAGETVVQVGTGSGYYTAILAQLVTPRGRVYGFEIDPDLAERAKRNLAQSAWVEVRTCSGADRDLPATDALYVNAGITQPPAVWLDALRPGGRLLFPLQPEGRLGGMLLVRKPPHERHGRAWPARFVSRAVFIGCHAPQVTATGNALEAAFAGGGWEMVRSFHRGSAKDDTCWFTGGDWWLSTLDAD